MSLKTSLEQLKEHRLGAGWKARKLNYYPHHIGDYLRDTAHLTALEDGTYRRMLDVYYASEKPLPLETQWVCRLVRARTPDEQEAVQEILRHYFEKRPDGWHNKRADEEIARGLKRIKTAKLNGKKGGRKKTQRVSENNPAGNPAGSRPSLAHQKPKAKSQREIIATRKTPIPDGFSISDRVREWAKAKGFENLEQHLESFVGKCKAKDYRYVDWDEGFMGAIRDDWAKLGDKPSGKVHYDA